jgi:hypothetical protein
VLLNELIVFERKQLLMLARALGVKRRYADLPAITHVSRRELAPLSVAQHQATGIGISCRADH